MHTINLYSTTPDTPVPPAELIRTSLAHRDTVETMGPWRPRTDDIGAGYPLDYKPASRGAATFPVKGIGSGALALEGGITFKHDPVSLIGPEQASGQMVEGFIKRKAGRPKKENVSPSALRMRRKAEKETKAALEPETSVNPFRLKTPTALSLKWQQEAKAVLSLHGDSIKDGLLLSLWETRAKNLLAIADHKEAIGLIDDAFTIRESIKRQVMNLDNRVALLAAPLPLSSAVPNVGAIPRRAANTLAHDLQTRKDRLMSVLASLSDPAAMAGKVRDILLASSAAKRHGTAVSPSHIKRESSRLAFKQRRVKPAAMVKPSLNWRDNARQDEIMAAREAVLARLAVALEDVAPNVVPAASLSAMRAELTDSELSGLLAYVQSQNAAIQRTAKALETSGDSAEILAKLA